MSNLVIVAIPDENDRVWKVSSEKVPHLTLLFLGDADKVDNADQITQFVEHAANTTLNRFYLPVDRRGELGEDKADVLFFKKGRYDYKAVRDFRMQLLKNDNIRTAYDSTEQFEGPWNPHLTLGYPTAPAKPQDGDQDYPFYDVQFTKIAVWFGDYEGPEFLLKDPWDEWETMDAAPIDVAMSDTVERGADYILEHYGVKGMQWGVRKERRSDEGAKSLFDPTGRSVKADLAENLVTGLVFFPLAIPSSVRLYRGAARGAKAKVQDVQDKKFEKVAKSQKGFVAIHNGASEKINRDIDGINKKYSDADMAVPAKRKKYDAEVQTLMQNAYRESANQIGNKQGTKHLDVEFEPNGMDFKIKVKEGQQKPTIDRVKHVATIDDNDVVTFSGKLKRDTTGYIVGVEFEDFEREPVDSLAQQSIEAGAEFMVYKGLMSVDDFLEHYGVKGMHWGERKAAVTSGAKSAGRSVAKGAKAVGVGALAVGTAIADNQFENRVKTQEGHAAVQREVAGKAKMALKRTDLPAIKEKPEYQKAKKLPNRLLHPLDPATKAYRKEVKAAYIGRLEDAANSMTNVSGTRQYTVRERGWELPAEGGALPKSKYYYNVTSRQIKHADGDGSVSTWHEVLMDEDGFITDIKDVDSEPVDPTVAHVMDLGADFLEHYGVKGMRWGQRKAPPTAVSAQGTSVVRAGNKRKTKIKVEGGENHEAHPDAIQVAEARAKLKKSGTVALSNQELQTVAKRLQLETQVAQLTSNRGQKFIQRQLEQQGQQTVQGLARSAPKKIAKRAGKAAATTAVTVALI
jgi:2'-5' RNA ligase